MNIKIKFKGKPIRICLRRHSDFSSFYQAFIENSYPNILKNISNEDTVIDAGANIGIFTLLASQIAKNVIAIEPDEENLKILELNLNMNEIRNVTVIKKGLYHHSNEILHFKSDGVMSAFSSNGEKMVETTTLDDVIEESNLELKSLILKMDIEGAEKYAFKNMEKTAKVLKIFEAEIHDEECEEVMRKYLGNQFIFHEEKAQSMKNVYKFALKHPIKTFKLEYSNKFRTARRLLKASERNYQGKYPKIVFAEKQ
ncbi:MAG: FkbM family methyltransferase [Thermoplasmataceae archaeon]